MGKHRKNPDRAQSHYSVGYGKPPLETRFKKGESRRGGSRKAGKSLAEEINELLREKVLVTEGGVQRRLSKRTAILKTMIAKAAKGDLRAADFLFRQASGAENAQVSDEAEMLTAEDLEMLADYLRRQERHESGEEVPASPVEPSDGA
ncbi:DUF5681 domain-containing protein [Tianweitania sediminis]|uniref:DUF5681 domain-containing protein n=1 Tax=Tianweitania sediminis TaxID=1502156 RepID=A0A8J7R1B5_9HYPH|nr:DUF5681 domain-containing protein [Tianweitania sediminis]MBP0438385.1 hypothetical protein [Tianweitania sediminis]